MTVPVPVPVTTIKTYGLEQSYWRIATGIDHPLLGPA